MSGRLIEEKSLTSMQQTMSLAKDDTVARIVALVDAMPERGEADALIEKMRPRLAHVRLPRPMRLSRLFYLPLDPVIVPGERWRRGMLAIPRPLLPHLTRHLEQEYGARMELLEATMRQAQARDEWALHSLGRVIWAEASAMLLTAEFSAADVLASGFAQQDHEVLIRAVARTLGLCVTLRDLAWRHRFDAGPPVADVRRCLEAALPHGRLVFGLFLTLVVEQFPKATFILGTAEQIATAAIMPAVSQAGERALASVTDAVAPGVLAGLDPAQLTRECDRLIGMLSALERSQFGREPERRPRILAMRLQLETDRLARFKATLDNDLIEAARMLAAPPTDADIVQLEAVARDLRRLEHTVRATPSAVECRRLLDHAAVLLGAGADLRLERGDRMRLVEILCDSDLAAQMFKPQAR